MFVQIHKTGVFDKQKPFALYNFHRKNIFVILQKIIATELLLWYTNEEIRMKFVFLHFMTFGCPKNVICVSGKNGKKFSWRNEIT